MAKIVVKNKVRKVKRKFQIETFSPEFLKKVSLGKSQITDIRTFVGKTIKMNLMYLTGKMRSQNIRLTFRVDKVESEKAQTHVCNYEYVSYNLKRFLKKDSDLIEDSFKVETSDKREITIKPFMVTKNKASSMVKTKLRTQAKEELINYIKTISASKVFEESLNEKLQIKIRNDIIGVNL